jgi:hypothetical protein
MSNSISGARSCANVFGDPNTTICGVSGLDNLVVRTVKTGLCRRERAYTVCVAESWERVLPTKNE